MHMLHVTVSLSQVVGVCLLTDRQLVDLPSGIHRVRCQATHIISSHYDKQRTSSTHRKDSLFVVPDTHVSVGVKVRPAPDIPADIQQQYDALQQCLYVLRRAHSTGRADEPAKALASAGLLDMAGLQFEDPLLACKGLQPWLLYMEVLRYACCAMHAVLCMMFFKKWQMPA